MTKCIFLVDFPLPVVLLLFAALSLLLHVFRMGYAVLMNECSPAAKVIFPFVEAPFLGLQVRMVKRL